ncbi:MAG TPA: restriction endonuclease subunit S [Candidatus Margulisbacteria bacterium]|nr:restriction endonuclease subunit S [Candidatus Margulisiibacteriota bacterium]
MKRWNESLLDDVANINPLESLPKGKIAKKIAMEMLRSFTKKVSGYSIDPYNGGVKFRNGDTIVARITPCLENGKTAYIDVLDEHEVGYGSTEYIVLREKPNVSDKQFLYYFAISDAFRDVAISAMTGSSGRQRVEIDVIKRHKFLLPSLPEQRAIAGVLSSLDDKIDLLHRQNKTLKAMAETLFRQWFVEEVNEDWETVSVGQFVKTNISSIDKNYELKTIRYLDTGSLTEGKIECFQNFEITDAPSRARRIVKHDDILISTVRPNQKHYGIIKHPDKDIIVSTGFCVITCEDINPHFIYMFLTTNDMTEYLHSIAEGSTSTYPSLKPSDIESLEFKLPPLERLTAFANYANTAWEKIDYNHKQIRTLEKLRDTLLPKLMSGEVRLKCH